jgi:hypothetical protein
MIRYRLDDLGCYQFEKLVQSLLKSSIGLGIESWGDRHDFGRDAYAEGPLGFPTKNVQSRGPFLFQVKFVENANAAGARPGTAIIDAVTKEAARIRSRKAQSTFEARFYVFVTNAPLTGRTRQKILQILSRVLPKTVIYSWSGDDVSDLLDQNPKIARSFPQLLSIRDLDALLGQVINKSILERSSIAIEIARGLVPVFAPTKAYERAWSILLKYHFVVLEGAPEVGKSAIAWMIGLTQVTSQWEAVVCRNPDEFFQMYKNDRNQVFIADDAFGRTEYDPTRTMKWETDLDLLLHRVDRKHWLIWTSRKHILQRAREKMDAQGKARSFPDPAAVTVNVQDLTVEERALILFRHARAAGLEKHAKGLVKEHAVAIVHDPDFTPERMRRFVRESLPRLVKHSRAGRLSRSQVAEAISEEISNPTKQIKITFKALSPAHKWFLIAMLEIGDNWYDLKDIYEDYCPASQHEPYRDVVEHLTESFVRTHETITSKAKAILIPRDWMHPSYRDLVIDQLTENAELRTRFLQRASLEGIKLAISDTGGAGGQRRIPFMTSAEAWDILHERCISIASKDDLETVLDLMEALHSSALANRTSPSYRRLASLLSGVCCTLKERWNRVEEVFDSEQLKIFCTANEIATPKSPMPQLDRSWEAIEVRLQQSLTAKRVDIYDFEPVHELLRFADVVRAIEPTFLRRQSFPEKYESAIQALMDRGVEEAALDPYELDPESLNDVREELENLANAVNLVGTLVSDKKQDAQTVATDVLRVAGRLESRRDDWDQDSREEDSSEQSSSVSFDVRGLFAEL